MRIRLFGSLEIEDAGRPLRPSDFGGRKPKQLLEILLTERGHIVSKSRLTDLLWDEPPKDAAATIDTYVSLLRRCLEPAGRPAPTAEFPRQEPPGCPRPQHEQDPAQRRPIGNTGPATFRPGTARWDQRFDGLPQLVWNKRFFAHHDALCRFIPWF